MFMSEHVEAQHNYKLIVKQVPGNSDKTWFKGQKLCVFCMCFFWGIAVPDPCALVMENA